ncbi:hypothetical protein [Neopusillimonas aromaticivorans]|uniref:hypothetical protein n=1 Tax=Neopusillimonas aromaticivorans TaxID=2979868 RepID=UPI00259543A4|nr:hypothetical protein [Neopusillimonas aromaticivorans]WJJ94204.1 hypothetical protein N7E01_03760 [Neopusillimonas aromaticivorans]
MDLLNRLGGIGAASPDAAATASGKSKGPAKTQDSRKFWSFINKNRHNCADNIGPSGKIT